MIRILTGIAFIFLSIWIGLKGPDYFYKQEKETSKKENGLSNSPRNHEKSHDENERKGNSDREREKIDALVDQHLKNTYYSIEAQKKNHEYELKKYMVQPGDNIINKRFSQNKSPTRDLENKPLFEQDRALIRMQEPFLSRKKPQLSQDPQAVIMEQLAQKQQEAHEEAEYRKRYIWEFRRNAWYGGYDVKVDSMGAVTSVRRLSPEERLKPFPEEGFSP